MLGRLIFEFWVPIVDALTPEVETLIHSTALRIELAIRRQLRDLIIFEWEIEKEENTYGYCLVTVKLINHSQGELCIATPPRWQV